MYIFSIHLCIVYAPIFFGPIVFDLMFKIAIVVMITWSIVFIINFVLTL